MNTNQKLEKWCDEEYMVYTTLSEIALDKYERYSKLYEEYNEFMENPDEYPRSQEQLIWGYNTGIEINLMVEQLNQDYAMLKKRSEKIHRLLEVIKRRMNII